MTPTWKDYVDAQDERTRAQNDARFADVIARLDVLTGRIDGLPTPPSIWQIAGVMLAGIGLSVGILAFAADRFDGGISAAGIFDTYEARQEARDAEQDARLDAILQELRGLTAAVSDLAP